jgi:MFS transporter, PAT family, beta-lactamase induction signal transducer AmpG
MKVRARRVAPVWLMGMGNAPFGLVGGFLVLPLPQLLAAQGVPEARIAAISAACFLPGFWTFLLGPLLDIRFSRRWYAALFAILAGVGMSIAILAHKHLLILEVALIISYAAAVLSSNALGGWLASIAPEGDAARSFQTRVSAWTQVAVFLGNGSMAFLAPEGIRRLPITVTALSLGLLCASPALIFPFIPLPETELAQARRLAVELRQSFAAFLGEIGSLLRRRDVLLTLLLFILPTGSFALTNFLGGVAHDFHATDAFVSRMGGAVLTLAGVIGSLLLPPLARRFRVLPLYLSIGSVGALFTLSILLLPHTPSTFAIVFLGENIFQALAFTTEVAITFAVIGRENPLAATQFSLLTSATVLPIVGMGILDGRAYTGLGPAHGLTGALAVDGGLCLVACVVMAIVLSRQKLSAHPSRHETAQ